MIDQLRFLWALILVLFLCIILLTTGFLYVQNQVHEIQTEFYKVDRYLRSLK